MRAGEGAAVDFTIKPFPPPERMDMGASSVLTEADFMKLLGEHAGDVAKILLRRGVRPSDLEDVLQDVWIRALKSRWRYDHERGDMGPWIRTIARYVARDHCKSRHFLQNGATVAEDAVAEPREPRAAQEEDIVRQHDAAARTQLDRHVRDRCRVVDSLPEQLVAALVRGQHDRARLEPRQFEFPEVIG